MKKNNRYYSTIISCRMSYLVQGILNNFTPLLFVTFIHLYGLSLDKISYIIAMNFGVQILVDYLSSYFVDKIGYRRCAVLSQVLSAVGLLMLGILPNIIYPYAGILISVFVFAVGSGLIETVCSPIMMACPIENKDAEMSLLHSHYCWGVVLTVLVSSLFFFIFGREQFAVLSCLWALVPAFLTVMFLRVPVLELSSDPEVKSAKGLFKAPFFVLFIILMFCAGASEQGLTQWISTYAESGLGIPKTLGDLVGTCMFAVLMGTSRILYGKFSEKLDLTNCMFVSGVMCVVCYLSAACVPNAAVSLAACVLCGATVGVMWPGIYSMASEIIPGGGTAMFAYLALAGDLGCTGGPTVVGFAADLFSNNLKIGILFAAVFPIVFAFIVKYIKIRNRKTV